ncbi:MAG: hypothetical protein GF393_04265 [Armatimonadia bacterium]|nr:hypothetical protein [Armatimonadia bacterium]
MGVAEAFGSTLIAVAALVGALLCVGGAIFRLFGMWITDRVLSTGEFAFITCGLVLLTAAAVTVEAPLSLALLLLVAGLGLVISLLPQISERVRGHKMMRDDIRRYEAALKHQPDVPFPHLKLAEIYQGREDWDRAIEHYQAYIQQHEISAEAKRSLERCLERRRMRDMGLRRCPVCGAENQRANTRCVGCGFYLRGTAEIMAALTTGEMMRVWQVLALVFLAPAIVAGVLAKLIPPAATILMLAVSLIATFMFLYGRMSSEGR